MTPSRQRTLVLGLILIGVVFVGFFGLRFFRAFREFRGHRPPPFPPADSQPVETDVELIRDWMTIGFISHTYRTPPNLLYKALDIPPRGNEDKSLQQLNDEYFPNQPGYVLETVKGTILASQPIPTALPPVTPPSTSIPPAAP
jgi:hypothetical protein